MVRQNRFIHALLLHSPLVGPSTARPLGAALTALGWSTLIPDLRTATASLDYFWSAAVQQCPSADVVIAHSGAGAVLPTVADATGAAMLFVDAVVPGHETRYRPAKSFVGFIDQLQVVDGYLPPWHLWWPQATLERLVPNSEERALLIEEMPRLPRSFYDGAIDLPTLWWTRPAAFLQLSPAYDDERKAAEANGWPVSQLNGQHLDLVARATVVAEQVTELVDRVDRSGQ